MSSTGRNPVTIWLFACCAMVIAMMLIGAVTRLTESGLSMVEWRPLIGWIPPLSETEWQRVFDLYRKTSEYALEHAGMTLADFKTIFWWEFIHRLWGRLIGIVFALPFLWFLIRRAIDRPLVPHLVALFLLGGLQGVIGWWMVKSGFVARTDVSQYRLVVHLAMALGILAYLLWIALGRAMPDGVAAEGGVRHAAWLLFAAVAVTVVAGGFVAGLNAGLIHNQWPLMGGAFVPPDYLSGDGWWTDVFEHAPAAQFHHRVLAYIAVAAVAIFAWRARAAGGVLRKLAMAVAVVAALQLALGIVTVIHVVPVGLGVAHQAGAIALFCLAVAALRFCYPPKKG
jgi:cytochrome c oxidase assembly protein subunit 15